MEGEGPMPGSIDRRPSWDEYFMTLANEVATRTTCLRRAVGAIIVKDRRILATGYNGVPTGLAHCAETGCLRQQLGVQAASVTRFAGDCCGAECDHPGCALWYQYHGRLDLHYYPAMRGVREDAHQRRYRGNHLFKPLPR